MTERELGRGERLLRGALAPLDIAPVFVAAKAFGTGRLLSKLNIVTPGLKDITRTTTTVVQTTHTQGVRRLKQGQDFAVDRTKQAILKTEQPAIKSAKKVDELTTKFKKNLNVQEEFAFAGGGGNPTHIDGMNLIDGKVGGKIPADDFNSLRKSSIYNAESDSITLGRYNADGKSYITEAKNSNSSYFDLGDGWGEIQNKYDLSNAKMFEYLNISALDDAVTSGKQIRFSHKPTKREYETTYLFK